LGSELILSKGFGNLGSSLARLDSKFSSTPLATDLLIFIGVVNIDGLSEGLKGRLVLFRYTNNSNSGGSLLSDQSAKARLALDNAVWDLHLSAESRQPNDQLNWINVVSDDDKLSLLLLDQSGNVVDTVLEDVWLLGCIDLTFGFLLLLGLLGSLSSSSSGCVLLGSLLLGLALHFLGGLVNKTDFLGCLALRDVFGKQLEELSGSVLVEGSRKLVDRGRDLQSGVKNASLSLELDVFRPSDKVAEVSSTGLNVSSDSKVSWSLFEERRGDGAPFCGCRVFAGGFCGGFAGGFLAGGFSRGGFLAGWFGSVFGGLLGNSLGFADCALRSSSLL